MENWTEQCHSFVSIVGMNAMTQGNSERKRFISSYSSMSHSPSRREPGGRNWSGSHDGLFLIGLICLFFIHPSTNVPEWHYPLWAGPSNIHHQSRKWFPLGIPIWDSLLGDSSLGQVDKLTNTSSKERGVFLCPSQNPFPVWAHFLHL